MRKLGPHTHGVIDYILLLSGKSVAITCKIDTITLIVSNPHVLVEYSIPTQMPRSINQKNNLNTRATDYVNNNGLDLPAANLATYDGQDLILNDGTITSASYL